MEALFEVGFHEIGCFQTYTLHNNRYGTSWLVIDSPVLDATAITLNLASLLRCRGS